MSFSTATQATKPRTDTNTTPRTKTRRRARAAQSIALRAHHARLHASRVARERARRAQRRTTRDARNDAPTPSGGVADDPRPGRKRPGDDHAWAVEETTRGDRGHDVVRGGRTERAAEGPGHELATARLAAESGVAGFLGSGARAREREGDAKRGMVYPREGGRGRANETRRGTRDARGEVEARARWSRGWVEARARANAR